MRRWPISILFIACYLCGLLLAENPLRADETVIEDPFSVRFAAPAEASTTLGHQDSFVRSMSPFDRQIRLGAD